MRSHTITEIRWIEIRINTSLLIGLRILTWLIGTDQQIELYVGVIEASEIERDGDSSKVALLQRSGTSR